MLIVILILLAINLIGLLYFIFRQQSGKKNIDESQNQAIMNLERRLSDLMISQLNVVRSSFDGTSRAMNDQIRNFTLEATQIKEELKQVKSSVKDVSSFQDIFKAPKLRGQWGESSLDNILSQHYPKEMYEAQHYFSSGEAVDFVLKLPDGRLLAIDSKFPSESFTKMTNANSEIEKNEARRTFISDIKREIDDISLKYILPSEGTLEMAIMYIPAEAVYYEIINSAPLESNGDLVAYAIKKRIILTSPNMLYLTLNTIEHWLRDTQISKKTGEIIKRLGKVRQDSNKLADDFRKLGKHLSDAHSAYEESEKRLSLMAGRMNNLIDDNEKTEILPDPKE